MKKIQVSYIDRERKFRFKDYKPEDSEKALADYNKFKTGNYPVVMAAIDYSKLIENSDTELIAADNIKPEDIVVAAVNSKDCLKSWTLAMNEFPESVIKYAREIRKPKFFNSLPDDRWYELRINSENLLISRKTNEYTQMFYKSGKWYKPIFWMKEGSGDKVA